MLKTSRNTVTASGLPLYVFCVVRNSTVRHQRLSIRSIHSSRTSLEDEPARPIDEKPRTGYQGFSNKPPPAIRNLGGKWNKDSAVATGSAGIDDAILSSFAPSRNSSAGWPRNPSTSASGSPRINRVNNYRRSETVDRQPWGGNATSTNTPKEGYTSSSQPRLGGYGRSYPEPGGASRGSMASAYPPKEGYTPSPQSRLGGYGRNYPEPGGASRGNMASAYPPKEGYAPSPQSRLGGYGRNYPEPGGAGRGGMASAYPPKEGYAPSPQSRLGGYGRNYPEPGGAGRGSMASAYPPKEGCAPSPQSRLGGYGRNYPEPGGAGRGSMASAYPPKEGYAPSPQSRLGGYGKNYPEPGGAGRGGMASAYLPKEGYAPSPQSRLGGYGRNYPEPSGASSDNMASAYPSKEGYTSPSRTATGYRGNRPEPAGASRFERDSTVSVYTSGAGYSTPPPKPSAQEGYEPNRGQSRERVSQDRLGQDRGAYGYGGQSGYGAQGNYGAQGLAQDRRGPTFQRKPREDGYASVDAFGSRSQQSTSNSSRPQESQSTPLTEGEELITRPSEPVNNDYEKRRAGRFRDKARANRGFDEYESAILEEEKIPRRDKKAARRAKKRENRDDTPKMIPLYLPEYISVPNLAKALKIRLDVFMEQMEQMGFTEMGHDHILNAEVAGLIAMEYNYEPIADKSAERDLLPRPSPEDRSTLPPRPPVVTIMGHVDHGKTSLLDWLRKASVAASEHGGITQHIGAFSVNMPGGKNITFLDTPGHAAFLSMRQRGANVTDIVILVVAADDSVKPQTIEAIKHAKAANVPIIVAANKIDKEAADVERVKQDLSRNGVDVEDYGGDTQVVCVSAKTGQGMEDLEEAAVALSEVLDMRAEIDGPCEGWILEASKKDIGRVATILVRRGTLRVGDAIVAGQTWCKVRQITDEHGVKIESAGPGTPIEVAGWKDQPEAGQLAIQAESEEKAKDVVDFRQEKAERLRQAADMEAINEKRRLHREMEEIEEKIKEEAKEKGEDPAAAVAAWEKTTKKEIAAQPKNQEVTFVVKGDVAGSVEAVVESVSTLGNDEVQAKVVRSEFGNVTEFDVDYAAAVEGYIICFNLPVEPEIVVYAREKGVTILSHNIIYHLVDDVTRQLSDRLPPTIINTVTGEAEISQIFNIKIKGKKYKPVAGCKVSTGVIARNNKVRVMRDGEAIFEGKLDSLKNVKENVNEMKKGTECGMGFEDWGDFKEGDLVQCYEVKFEPRTL